MTDLALTQQTLAITDEQRNKALELVKANPKLGNAPALRQAGVEGTRGELRRLIDPDLAEQLREARGWSIVDVEQTTWDVAKNPEHPAWDRANARVLKAYHPAFRDRVDVEHTGPDGGPMQVELNGVRVTGLNEVIELARSFGIGIAGGLREGLSTEPPRSALPAAEDLLPDPSGD